MASLYVTVVFTGAPVIVKASSLLSASAELLVLLQWNLNTCLCVKFEGVDWNESPRVRSLLDTHQDQDRLLCVYCTRVCVCMCVVYIIYTCVCVCVSVCVCVLVSALSDDQLHRRQLRAKKRREKALEKSERDKVH